MCNFFASFEVSWMIKATFTCICEQFCGENFIQSLVPYGLSISHIFGREKQKINVACDSQTCECQKGLALHRCPSLCPLVPTNCYNCKGTVCNEIVGWERLWGKFVDRVNGRADGWSLAPQIEQWLPKTICECVWRQPKKTRWMPFIRPFKRKWWMIGWKERCIVLNLDLKGSL